MRRGQKRRQTFVSEEKQKQIHEGDVIRITRRILENYAKKCSGGRIKYSEFYVLVKYCGARYLGLKKSERNKELVNDTLKYVMKDGDVIMEGQTINGLDWTEWGQYLVSSLIEDKEDDSEDIVFEPEKENDVNRVCDELVREYMIINREESKVSFREFEFVVFYVIQQVIGIKNREITDKILKQVTATLLARFPSLSISSDQAYLMNLNWQDKALNVVDVWNDNDSELLDSMSDESSDNEMKLEDDELEDDEDDNEVEEVEPMDMSDDVEEEEEFDETTQRGLFQKIVSLTSVDGVAPLFSLKDFDDEQTLFEFYDFSGDGEVQRLVNLLLEKKRIVREKNRLTPEEERKKLFFEDFGRSFTDSDRDELLKKLARREKNVVMTCRGNMGHGKKEQLLLFDCVLQRPSDFSLVSQKPHKDLCDFCGMWRMVDMRMRDRKSGITFLLGSLCHDLAKTTIALALALKDPEYNPNKAVHKRKLQRLVQKMSEANELKRTGSE